MSDCASSSKVFLSLLGCLCMSAAAIVSSTSDDYRVLRTTSSNVSVSQPASFSCHFTNLWTAERHPAGYPSDGAHWSATVLVSHSKFYQMWARGELASPGVESLAKTGSTFTIINKEIAAAGVATGPAVRGRLLHLILADDVTFQNLPVIADRPYISTITMIGPSTDWFTGFHDFDARNLSTSTWYNNFIIDSYPWDTGTETDLAVEENPHLPIFRYTIESLPSGGQFADPNRTTVLPVANWNCTLVVGSEMQTSESATAKSIHSLTTLLLCLIVAKQM